MSSDDFEPFTDWHTGLPGGQASQTSPEGSGSQSVVSGWDASATQGSRFQMQIPGPAPGLPHQKLRGGAQHASAASSPGDSDGW